MQKNNKKKKPVHILANKMQIEFYLIVDDGWLCILNFLYIYILFIIYKIKNLDIYKLFCILSIHYLLLFINK